MSNQNTEHKAIALRRMLEQFQGSDVQTLAGTFLDQVQAFEDAIWPLLGERGLANATGHRLDGIGQILNVSRGGRDDATYRKALETEAAILNSDGTAEVVLSLVHALVEMPAADYEFVEYYPKTIYVRPVDHAISVDPDYVGTNLRRAVSAATEVLFVYSFLPDANTFQFSTTTSSENGFADTGFGEVYTDLGTWLYDSASTSLSGITSGTYRFNHADITKATQMYIHDEDASVTDKSAFLAALDVASGSSLSLYTVSQSAHIYISNVTDNTGTFTFDITVTQEIGTIPYAEVTVLSASNTGGYMAGNA